MTKSLFSLVFFLDCAILTSTQKGSNSGCPEIKFQFYSIFLNCLGFLCIRQRYDNVQNTSSGYLIAIEYVTFKRNSPISKIVVMVLVGKR